MGLEGILSETKKFVVKQTIEYPGQKGCAIGNGIRAIVGYAGYQYFDNDIFQAVCITYAVIKGIQFIKDVIKYVWW